MEESKPYQKEDGKWYISLSAHCAPSAGEAGPFNTKPEAETEYDNYIKSLNSL